MGRQAAALESVMIGDAKRILGCTLLEVTWGWIHYRVVEAKLKCGMQRKFWCKVVFSSLGLDKAEWLEDIRKGSCSLKSFLGVAGEGIDERESSKLPQLNFRLVK